MGISPEALSDRAQPIDRKRFIHGIFCVDHASAQMLSCRISASHISPVTKTDSAWNGIIHNFQSMDFSSTTESTNADDLRSSK